MKDYNSFMNMNINMDDFENTYNSMAINSMTFGGGTMKVKDLLNKYLSKKKQGGTSGVESKDNFFYLTRPQDITATNLHRMSDYTYKNFDYPGIVNNTRN